MKTTLELVHELQALLDRPEKWTQRALARDSQGRKLYRMAAPKNAACWCLAGACDVIEGPDCSKLTLLARRAIGEHISLWNDATCRTFADIQTLMAKMEELARQEAA